ncbi:MAG: bifunctional oligoribonuclease/PAP phosphatase NrnA [candidate division Zixibacteria bacterium]|nr:bifunctional oligoribonuclease/PAP phosphatase NrnA [candidate division Zixibacteria bacterium]
MSYPKRMNSQNKEIYKEIAAQIKGSQSILITSHEDPDGDSIGSQLAMRRLAADLNKVAVIINHGLIPLKYRFLPEIEHITEIRQYNNINAFDLIIMLDCPTLERSGEVNILINKKQTIINIDHHPDNTVFGNINLIDSKASSVGEILCELFLHLKIRIDEISAAQLFAAILTDTGRFRYETTGQRTMEVAGHLIECGAHPREICDQIYYSISESTLRLTGQVLSGIEFFQEGKICLLRLNRTLLEANHSNLSETDGLTDYALFGKDVMVGALLREIDDRRTEVSLRSRGSLDVSRLAHKYGGGGHYNAAGFAVNLPLEQVDEKLLKDIRELINGSI